MTIRTHIRAARGLLLRDRPIYVHFAVTHRCNLSCATCTIWKHRPERDELSLDAIRELASTLARIGAVQVSLGGGEPTLRADLPEVVAAFLAAGLRTRVLTNGVGMTAAVARSLIDAGLRDVSFSLDSLRRDPQEYIDNRAGTFEIRLDNLLDVAALLPRRNSLPLLNTVVTPRNIDELPDILSLAERIGFFVSFIPVHGNWDSSGEHRFYGNDRTLAFAPEDNERVRATYRFLLEAKAAGRPVINSSAFLRRSPDHLLGGRVEWPCRAGRLYLSIAPDGVVSACHAFEGTEGIPFRELERAVREPAYKRRQEQLAASCEGCFRPCWAEVSYLVLERSSLVEMVRAQWCARRPRPVVDRSAIRKSLGLAEVPAT